MYRKPSIKGTVAEVIIFFNCVQKLLWYWEHLKISGLYDENCALGVHLKFVRRPHNNDFSCTKGDNIVANAHSTLP